MKINPPAKSGGFPLDHDATSHCPVLHRLHGYKKANKLLILLILSRVRVSHHPPLPCPGLPRQVTCVARGRTSNTILSPICKAVDRGGSRRVSTSVHRMTDPERPPS